MEIYMSKLVKTKNRTLFGVCGGIGAFLGIDASIVRILFILGAIASGSVLFWVYLVLALVLPNED
jgi:phage shock protein PspC (stress-responsive transcriptional regulator)